MQTGPAGILGIAITALLFLGLLNASQTHDPNI
jgi:hypothetical protein